MQPSEAEKLKDENKKLREKLNRYERTGRTARRVSGWLFGQLIGSDIKETTQQLASATERWNGEKHHAPVKELIELMGAIAARLTRIGIYRIVNSILLAIVTLWLSVTQVILFKNQNKIMQDQLRVQYAENVRYLSSRIRELHLAYLNSKNIYDRHEFLTSRCKDQFEEKKICINSPLNAKVFATLSDAAQSASNTSVVCNFAVPYPDLNLMNYAIRMDRPGELELSLNSTLEWWSSAVSKCKYERNLAKKTLEDFEAKLKALDTDR